MALNENCFVWEGEEYFVTDKRLLIEGLSLSI